MNRPASSPLVSILIPAYNCDEWIGSAIESALGQSYSPIEVIVVDDGSTDRTGQLLSAYQSRGVRVFHQVNKGAASARNLALGESTGEWIQFLDGDDLLHPHKISLQIARAAVLGPKFIFSAEWGRFSGDPQHADFRPSILLQDSLPLDWLIAKYSTNEMVQPGAWLVHRSLIGTAGNWNERLSLNDDGEFFDRMILNSTGVRHVPGAQVFYRSHAGRRLSGQVTLEAAESALLAIDLCVGRLLEATSYDATLSKSARSACGDLYRRFACQFLPIHPELSYRAERLAGSLGGGEVELPGGPGLQILRRLVGWRVARWMQYYYYQWLE